MPSSQDHLVILVSCPPGQLGPHPAHLSAPQCSSPAHWALRFLIYCFSFIRIEALGRQGLGGYLFCTSMNPRTWITLLTGTQRVPKTQSSAELITLPTCCIWNSHTSTLADLRTRTLYRRHPDPWFRGEMATPRGMVVCPGTGWEGQNQEAAWDTGTPFLQRMTH